MIALLDYGAGNLTSVRKALAFLEVDVTVPRTPADLGPALGIIVPGVGHFDRTRAIDAAWTTAIHDAVGRGAALLGICLGMQWLFEGSEEAPGLAGLGLFTGRCARFAISPTLKIPHVGWNSLTPANDQSLLAGVPPGSQVYFTHSYAAPVVDETVAVTTHGVPFTAALQRGRIAGVQFHPEKSGEVGLRVLRNWLSLL